MNMWLLVMALAISPFIHDVYAQESITVNATTPCFLNYTAGVQMWQNCGFHEDWLAASLLPFEWVTGGYFTMILVAVFLLMIYIKYQKTIYVLVLGMVFFPLSYAFFPSEFLSFAIIMIGLSIGIMIYFGFKRQTD